MIDPAHIPYLQLSKDEQAQETGARTGDDFYQTPPHDPSPRDQVKEMTKGLHGLQRAPDLERRKHVGPRLSLPLPFGPITKLSLLP